MTASARLGYVLSRFPHLPETFTLREMLELERLGWRLDLYAIQHQRSPVRHPEAERLEREGHYLAYASPSTVRANLRHAARAPVQYGALLALTVRGNSPSRDFLLKGLALFPGAVAIADRMRARGVTHLHGQYGTHPALLALLASEILGIGYSFTVHAHDLFVDTTMLVEKVRRAAFITAISEFNRQRLLALCGAWATPKLHVVRCGVDLHAFPFRQRDDRSAECAPYTILAVGSLQEYKGHEHLIRACARLRDLEPGQPFRCVIAGGGVLMGPLSRLIQRLGLTRQVRLLGAQDQHAVRALMQEADLLVLPSVVARSGQMEGIPVVLMEAMASGLPVVASALSGIPELVRHEETGLLVAPTDETAIAEAVVRGMRHPAEARARAVRARRLVEQDYDLARNTAQLSDLFASVVPARAAPTLFVGSG